MEQIMDGSDTKRREQRRYSLMGVDGASKRGQK